MITLVDEKETGKNDQENDNPKTKVETEATILHDKSLIGNNDDAVLKDSVYEASAGFGSKEEGRNEENESEGVKPDEDVWSPSRLTAKIYSQLESEEARLSGFHFEKDASGREILMGPVSQAIANSDDAFVYQNKTQNGSSSKNDELSSLRREERLKSARLEEQLLNDPLAKVSYVLNHEEEDSNHQFPTSSGITSNTSSDIENNVNAVQTWNDSNYSDVREMKMNASNMAGGSVFSLNPGSLNLSRGGSISLQNSNDVKSLLNKTLYSTKPKLSYPDEMKQGLENSPDMLNVQLPELVKSVVERLGNLGSQYVSVELAKHPMMKDIWANAIAQALVKESDKMSQLDSEKKLKNISSIESDSSRITELLNDLSRVRAQDGHKTKESNRTVGISLATNQTKERKHAVKGSDSTSTSPLSGLSLAEYRLNNNTPVYSRQDEPKLHNLKLHRFLNAKEAGQLGNFKTPINRPVLKDFNLQGNENNHIQGAQLGILRKPMNQAAPKFNFQGDDSSYLHLVSKTVERLGSAQSIKTGEQQDHNSKPVLMPSVNGFVSNKEISTQLDGNSIGEQTITNKPVLASSVNGFISNKATSTQLPGIHEDHRFRNKPDSIGEQTITNKPVLASSVNGLISNKATSTQLSGIHEDHRFRNKPDLPHLTDGMLSTVTSDRAIDAPFLYNNFTSLDPDETKYVELNLMSDPVAREGFSDSNSPYSSQQQLQEEDAKEASYLEHQINDAGHLVQEIFPSLNSTMSKDGKSEASLITGQVMGVPFAKADAAEFYARNNNFLNAKNRENAQIMASVVNEDQKASFYPTSNQERNIQNRQHLHYGTTQTSSTEETTTLASPSSSYNNDLSYRDETKTKADVGQMFLSPKTVSDISAVDLAPISHLAGLQEAFNLNKPKTFMYQSQNDGNGQKEFTTGGKVANYLGKYGVNPFPITLARPQKKHIIHKSKRKHRKKSHRTSDANASSSTVSSPSSPPILKYVKTTSKHAALRIKPTKSRNQPGTRDSDISPTSVIFGLTAKEMKELETHLAHGPHALGGIGENDRLQIESPAPVGYYNTKKDEEQEKSIDSIGNFVNKLMKHGKLTRKERNKNTVHHKKAHKMEHAKNSPYRLYKKVNNNMNAKRDLESWESSTDVLNSDLDQIRGLSPKAQEDISKVILKDYEGHQRNIKEMEALPLDENDPSYAFERSLQAPGRENHKTVRISKNVKRRSHGRRQSGSRNVMRRNSADVEGKKVELHKKRGYSYGDPFNDTESNRPLLMRGNKILNGDVIPLDDVKNEFAQGMLLETLRKESEGDLQYVNAIAKHDLNRMRNMFQSAGDEIGMKRDSKGTLKPTKQGHLKLNKIGTLRPNKERHSKLNKFAARRDITDWATEFNDGTFRSPDFERQLSRALKQESEHDLNYMDTLENLNKQGKAAAHSELQTSSRRRNTQKEGKKESTNNRSKDYLVNTEEKLKAFLQNSNNNDEGLARGKYERGEKREWTNSEIQGSVFRDLTPEGKVLSTDYKDLGNFGSDAQAQLASVLQIANSGDQRDLKELEKLDNADEKDVESLFKPTAEAFKRSILDNLAAKKEGTIETIADISDPGSKEKEINIVVSGDEGKINQL